MIGGGWLRELPSTWDSERLFAGVRGAQYQTWAPGRHTGCVLGLRAGGSLVEVNSTVANIDTALSSQLPAPSS
ncbi:hypothetical protein GGTG_13915 [Gaeumannomyces tritici R3-111a-1]|uniref:Uncharacterized protein n=1 Tax=Gaeumannomyces tritici (strain R3-111a-1) TaxID=644352 RepID=J3PK68_GAET3|nr:hypothetical protein GGTG_13915 [Gaeumannomyces tritici R3-111a-1]EJT68508.1 hypothetical protein GGTG_13915 [Gaeumannomyces tritici R3-111a-1]